MKKQLSIMLAILLISIIAVVSLYGSDGTPAPLGIVPSPNPGNLTVNIWTNKSTYTVGENAFIYFTVNQPAYIYIYDLQPDGVVRLIFPNSYSQSNFVNAGAHTLPDANYQFQITPPAGLERLQIFASLTPLSLTPSMYQEPFPQIAPNANSAMGQIQGQIMGITPTPTWATAWTSFTIIEGGYSYNPPPSYTPPSYTPPGYYPQPPSYYPYPPFSGWFPGGSWYWSHGGWHSGTPGSGWYWYFGPDGKWHFVFRIHIGGN